ncbi:hypothetical protein LO771_07620 [Streptacidiphilus sp. ASG 303]|uniref:hypothetical protein n=1 Tax=Streptacidiphilus sp. ASG 303 TaxID=2896847 RepID=UPI001E478943|nr:hypothetical protein [Streptacidiphilus sp. ASG 303]MCD0482285.1 hypothetical protein [Streptacidiphilus sp. ASG 303]
MPERGGTVRFGGIAVATAGVATPPRPGAVAWGRIRKVGVENGLVVLSEEGRRTAWSRTPVERIPDATSS